MTDGWDRGIMANVRHVIWDWNGTLLDDAYACVEALNRMLDARGLDAIDLERYREFFTFPVRDYYRTLGFDMEREDWGRMAREYHEHYAETAAAAPLRSDSRRVLEALAAERVGMSILSACEERILGDMVRVRGVEAFFQHMVGLSDLYAASKLEQGGRLLTRLGIAPVEVLLVGDTLHDYEVAQALNCRCILVAGGHQSENRLRRADCPVLTDVRLVLEPWTRLERQETKR